MFSSMRLPIGPRRWYNRMSDKIRRLLGLAPELTSIVFDSSNSPWENVRKRELPHGEGEAWIGPRFVIVSDRSDSPDLDAVFPPHPETLFLASLIPEAPHARARFLDIGVGSGLLSVVAAKKGWRTFGVDLNHRAISAARDNARINRVSVALSKGDLAAALGERVVDLCFANLPFEITPPECVNFLHSDGGGHGDSILKRFLPTLSNILTIDGMAIVFAFSLISGTQSRFERLVGKQTDLDCVVLRLSEILDTRLLVGSRFDREKARSWLQQLQKQGYIGFVIEVAFLKRRENRRRLAEFVKWPIADLDWMLPVGGGSLSRPVQNR